MGTDELQAARSLPTGIRRLAGIPIFDGPTIMMNGHWPLTNGHATFLNGHIPTGPGRASSGDSPLLSLALENTRDRIGGDFSPMTDPPLFSAIDDPAQLPRWAPWIRLAIYSAELDSKVAFKVGPAGDRSVQLRHLQVDVDGTGKELLAYQDLLTLVRPTEAEFAAQLPLIEAAAANRLDRLPEIHAQLDGGLDFLHAYGYLDPGRTPWTIEVITAVLDMTVRHEMRIKHAFACARPNQHSPQVQPMIFTPLHSTYPSGHAAEVFAVATVLSAMLSASGPSRYPQYRDPIWTRKLYALVTEIALNRTVAGLHFPVDNVAGAATGIALGRYFIARATAGSSAPEAGIFRPIALNHAAALSYSAATSYRDQLSNPESALWGELFNMRTPYTLVGASSVLSYLWQRALSEWANIE